MAYDQQGGTSRGNYDEAELIRINNLLTDQRKNFLNEEKNTNTLEGKIKAGFYVFVGISAIIIILKVIKK